MTRARYLLLAIVLIALVAAGCTSDDDTTTTGEPDTDPSTSDAPSDDIDPDDPPAELTASFRGVTEDTIEVGVVAIDFAELAEMGVDTNSGDAAAIYTAAVEAINDRGGINGRMLEITTEAYLPVGGVEAEGVCTRLTEDLEVFIVVGAMRQDNVLCYTEQHDTAAIAVSQQTQERIDRSIAPYVTVRSPIDLRSTAWAEAMVDSGVFEGETVGVLGFADVDQELYDGTVAALREVGVEPVEGLVESTGGDLVASRSFTEVVLERFSSEGVTVTVHASAIADGLEFAQADGYETQWVQNPGIGPGSLTATGVDFSYVDDMLTILPTSMATVDQPAMADDPAVAECVTVIEERTDEVIDFSLEPEESNLGLAINACGVATILELGLTAAGADLTNDTLAAGFAGLGEFPMAGFPSMASLGPDDQAAADAGDLARFSAADGAWVFVD